jgi:hypothetical protein
LPRGHRSCESRRVGEFVLHVEPSLAGAPLVFAFEGWNDAGQSATSAVRFLCDAFRIAPLAEIDCEEYLDLTVQRPVVRLVEGQTRAIEWPRTELGYGSLDASREIVTGIGVEPHLHWRRFCDSIAALIARLRVGEVVLLGAYLADVVYSRPVEVTGFASTPGRLDAFGVKPTVYEGPTGIVGVLADRLRRDGVETVSLWAGLPHYIAASPNPRGALALIQKLADGLELKLDDEPLRSEAAAFEERVSALVAADPELLEYVRQLKRRDFAQ